MRLCKVTTDTNPSSVQNVGITLQKTVSKSLYKSLSENNAVCFQFCDIIALPVNYKLI